MTKLLQVSLAAILLCGSYVSASTFDQNSEYETPAPSTIQRVRIDFVTPLGFTRHLLLAFTSDNAATDAVDYGYDASNIETLPDDLNWIIEDGRYVIQGVGAFDTQKSYPLGMFLSNSGSISIKLDRLENFDEAIDVYILDKEKNTYTKISEFDLDAEMEAGDYTDRFFITFSNSHNSEEEPETLNDSEDDLSTFSISYQKNNHQLLIRNSESLPNLHVALYTINGKRIHSETHINSERIAINTEPFIDQIVLLQIQNDKSTITRKLLFH